MDSWGFSNVHQVKVDEELIEIHFQIDEFPYSLAASRMVREYFSPVSIRHRSADLCPHCQRNNILLKCPILDFHRTALFHQLIQVPSIRLEWLYLPHV